MVIAAEADRQSAAWNLFLFMIQYDLHFKKAMDNINHRQIKA
jgi:hypothetical protein